jgi:molybdopterin molybdotransferase
MDGWAVAGSPPWRIVDRASLEGGDCRPIVTGGAIPAGAFAVLRSEHASLDAEGRLVPAADARPDEPRPGEHIRYSGEEARSGEVLIAAGTMLNPAHVALAASAGHDELDVQGRPRVRLLFTGDEVVLRGIPGPGFVRDSFGPMLPVVAEQLGAVVESQRRVQDSLDAMMTELREDAASSDILITTGGTGNSSTDHVRGALQELDVEFLIDGIRMRPGGPSLLARMPDGRLVVGLPGNPLAALIALITIGQPLITGSATLGAVEVGADVAGRAHTSLLVPYRLDERTAVPLGWSGSGMMRGMAEARGILVCPPEGVTIGDTVESLNLPWV